MAADSWSSSFPVVREKDVSELKSHHIKLWIATLKNLPKHPSYESAAIFDNQIVAYVDILGSVIDFVSAGKSDIYMGN